MTDEERLDAWFGPDGDQGAADVECAMSACCGVELRSGQCVLCGAADADVEGWNLDTSATAA